MEISCLKFYSQKRKHYKLFKPKFNPSTTADHNRTVQVLQDFINNTMDQVLGCFQPY